MNTIDIAGSMGIIAAVLFTCNMIMGILLSSAYRKLPIWIQIPERYKKFKMRDLHNYTSYLILVFVLIHILLLPFDPAAGISFKDLLWPIHIKHQPYIILLGWIAFIAFIIVMVTTQKIIKNAIGSKTWRSIHIISYGTCILYLYHGVVMDPLLKDRAIDFLDGEKLLIELLGLILIIAFYWRYHYKQNKLKA